MKPAPETTLSAMIAAETPDPALSSRLAAAASAFARRKVEVRALAIHYDWSIAAVSSDTQPMLPIQISPVMKRLHEALEYYDEYQRPVKGFFMTELDHNSQAPDRHPVLVYIQPTSLSAPKTAERLPPDWIGEVLSDASAPSYLAKYARHGVAEYWRVRAYPPDQPPTVEVHSGADRAAGTYDRNAVFTGEQVIVSAAFPGLQLRPVDLLPSDEPLVPPDPPTP